MKMRIYEPKTIFLTFFIINLFALSMLIVLSLLNQYSALKIYPGSFPRHLFKTVLAVICFFGAFLIKERQIKWAIPYLYILTLAALTLVLLTGTSVKGATRWLSLGPFSFQPCEIAKIIVPLTSAHVLFLTRNASVFTCVSSCLLITLIPFLLVAKQPDLGSSLLIAYSGLLPLLLLKIPTRFFFYLTLCLIVLSPAFWSHLHPYQQQRIKTLFSPHTDIHGAGYHIHQSKISIGSGEISGLGWKQNTQASLGYLPEADTDFAFALFAQEWGFLGCTLVIILLYLFYSSLILLSLRAKTQSLQMICFSLGAPQFLYCFINIGMISGLLPVVGVPLPFFSRGGTSILIQSLTLGIIYRFIFYTEKSQEMRG